MSSLWRLTAMIERSQQVYDTRRSVYEQAMINLAYRPRTAEHPAIAYDTNDNLHIDLLFDDKRSALSLETALSTWNSSPSQTFRQITGRVKDLRVAPMPPLPADDLVRVMLDDYVHSDTDLSPTHTVSTTVAVEPTPMRRMQMVQARLPTHGKAEQLHIIPKWLHPRKDENNFLYASRQFHEHFDGLNKTPTDTPTLAIYPDVFPPPSVLFGEDEEGQQRFEVKVIVEFCDQATLEDVVRDLKPYESLGSLKVRLSLYVRDPLKYAKNLVKKASMTFNTWKSQGWPAPTLDAWEARDEIARVVEEPVEDEPLPARDE